MKKSFNLLMYLIVLLTVFNNQLFSSEVSLEVSLQSMGRDNHYGYGNGSHLTLYELGESTEYHVPFNREQSSILKNRVNSISSIANSEHLSDTEVRDINFEQEVGDEELQELKVFFNAFGIQADIDFLSELYSKTEIGELYNYMTTEILQYISVLPDLGLAAQLAQYQKALIAAYITYFFDEYSVRKFFEQYPDVLTEIWNLIYFSDESFKKSPRLERETLRYKLAQFFKSRQSILR